MRVSRDIAQQHEQAEAGCSPDCCDSRVDAMKRSILAAIDELKSAVENS